MHFPPTTHHHLTSPLLPLTITLTYTHHHSPTPTPPLNTTYHHAIATTRHDTHHPHQHSLPSPPVVITPTTHHHPSPQLAITLTSLSTTHHRNHHSLSHSPLLTTTPKQAAQGTREIHKFNSVEAIKFRWGSVAVGGGGVVWGAVRSTVGSGAV